MTNEEKYQLVLSYLNNLISNNKSVKYYESPSNSFFGIEELKSDNKHIYISLGVSIMTLSILFEDGSQMKIGLFNNQKDEIKYLFNKLVEISEENCIKYLKMNDK